MVRISDHPDMTSAVYRDSKSNKTIEILATKTIYMQIGFIKSEFSKKVCFSRISRLKVAYMFMALTNSLVVLFIAVLL